MGVPVVTVAAGGLPVVDVSAIAPMRGVPVTEASNGRGIAVTKVVGKPGMPVVYETIGVGAPVGPFMTLNGPPVGTVSVTNGNLTATHTSTISAGAGVYGGPTQTLGKYYFEDTITATTSTANCVGIMLAGATFADLVTNGTKCTAVYQTGAIWSNNVNTTKTIGAIVGADIVGIALDLTGRLGWFRKKSGAAVGNWNGDPTANPATGIGGVTIAATAAVPAVGFGTATVTNDSMTCNFGQSAFAMSVPAGFVNWPG